MTKQETKEYNRQYRLKNRERLIEYDRFRYIREKEKRNEWAKTYYRKNAESIKQRVYKYYRNNKDACERAKKIYYEKHKLEIRLYQKQYQTTNRERINANTRKWRKANPESTKLSTMNQRIKRKRNMGDAKISLSYWKDLLKKFNYKCAYCGEKKNLSIDHIYPLSRGGIHHQSNILPACISCNSKKWNNIYMEFLPIYLKKFSYVLNAGLSNV